MSLSLCAAVIPPLDEEARGLGEDAFDLPEVPRQGRADRVTVSLRPSGGGRIVCRPYPFDLDPLPVSVQARVLDVRGDHPSSFETRWHAVQPEPIRFEYCSA